MSLKVLSYHNNNSSILSPGGCQSYLSALDYKRLEMISQDCKCDFVVVTPDLHSAMSEESRSSKSQLPEKPSLK